VSACIKDGWRQHIENVKPKQNVDEKHSSV